MDYLSKIAELKDEDIAILGISFDKNSSYLKGPALAPDEILSYFRSPSANMFSELGYDLALPSIIELGNISIDDYLQDISQPIIEILQKGAIPFSLGGDHSVTYPIIKGFQSKYKRINILHFDAHSDTYDNFEGDKHSHACPFARIMELGVVDRLVQIGIRTLNQHQREQVDKFGIEVITMDEFMQDLKLELNGPLYISLDMDALDPAFAPGVSHHEPGGLSSRDIIKIIHSLNCEIIGADIVEYNPKRDINGVTGMTAAKLMKELLGQIIHCRK